MMVDKKEIYIEKREERKTNKTLQELKQEISNSMNNESFKREVIKSVLKKKSDIRKTYLSLILISPARVGELMEKIYVVKRTLYNHLYNLVTLGVVKKANIMDLFEKKEKNEEEKLILEKFKKWTATMNEGMRKQFTAKTNYWCLTDLGKDVNIIDWALICEKRMKSGDEDG